MLRQVLGVKSLIVVVAFSLSAMAQSSSRSPSVLPTVEPIRPAAPTYSVPQSQGYAAPQGSGTVVTPGSSSRSGGTIIAQPAQGSGTMVQSGGTVVHQGSGTMQGTVVPRGGTTVQGSGTMGAMEARQNAMPVAAAPSSFEQKLWGYLLRAKYRNWAPVPGKSDAMYEGQSPHGAFLKMYLNRKAAGNPSTLPNGSIIIKENFSPTKSLAAITVMYRTKGYNPESGDWYWVKYNPDGSVANKTTEKGVMRLGGRVGGCIDCHSGADGGDFAFFND